MESAQSLSVSLPAKISTQGMMIAARCSRRLCDAWNRRNRCGCSHPFLVGMTLIGMHVKGCDRWSCWSWLLSLHGWGRISSIVSLRHMCLWFLCFNSSLIWLKKWWMDGSITAKCPSLLIVLSSSCIVIVPSDIIVSIAVVGTINLFSSNKMTKVWKFRCHPRIIFSSVSPASATNLFNAILFRGMGLQAWIARRGLVLGVVDGVR